MASKTTSRNSTRGSNASAINRSSEGEDRENDDVPVPETIFQEVPPIFSRNFMIADVCYVSPPFSGLGTPGPDGEVLDISTGGLAPIPSHVLAEIPDRCRQAFDEVRSEEAKWKASWGGETTDCARGQLRICYNV